MNESSHLSGPQVLICVVSVANICLLVTAAFHREGTPIGGVNSTLRQKFGLAAAFLGLSNQVFYCLLLAM